MYEKKNDKWTKNEIDGQVNPFDSKTWRDKSLKEVNWYLTKNVEFENQIVEFI